MNNNLKAERTLTAEELQQVMSECDELTDATDFWGHNPSFIKAMASMAIQSLSTQQPMGEMKPDFYGVWSGKIHVGTWDDEKTAREVASEYDSPKVVPLSALHPNQESGE